MEKFNFIEGLSIVEESKGSIKQQLKAEADKLYKGNTPVGKAPADKDGFHYDSVLNVTNYFVKDSAGKTQIVFAKGQ